MRQQARERRRCSICNVVFDYSTACPGVGAVRSIRTEASLGFPGRKGRMVHEIMLIERNEGWGDLERPLGL